jgi:hypothetical protein
MKTYMMDDGFFYTRDDLILSLEKGKHLAPKPGAIKRDPEGNPCLPVWKTDAMCDPYYYLEKDIYWRVEPTEWDCGVTAPIEGAVPRDQYGRLV